MPIKYSEKSTNFVQTSIALLYYITKRIILKLYMQIDHTYLSDRPHIYLSDSIRFYCMYLYLIYKNIANLKVYHSSASCD